jgi:hypothetical protein
MLSSLAKCIHPRKHCQHYLHASTDLKDSVLGPLLRINTWGFVRWRIGVKV